jgi:hypothetical protein
MDQEITFHNGGSRRNKQPLGWVGEATDRAWETRLPSGCILRRSFSAQTFEIENCFPRLPS